MKVLLIHTCAAEGSIALVDTARGPALGYTAALPPRTASEALLPAIGDLLRAAQWPTQDLAAVAVVHGPGSFTGVRTGLSVGKGLCEGLGIPLVTVSRLALLAQGAGLRYSVLDAGRGEFYVGRCRDGVTEEESLMEPGALRTELERCPGQVVVCEEKVVAALAGWERVLRIPEPAAAAAVDLALARLRDGADDVLGDANYVRWTDAQIFAKRPPPV